MSKLFSLIALELRSFYGFNQFLHSKDKRERRRYKLLAVTVCFVFAVFCSYSVGLSIGFHFLGLADIVPVYFIFLTSLICLIFNLFKVGERLYGRHGYDLLASMPIKSFPWVFSRFVGIYCESLPFCFVIMLPGMIAYGVMQKSAAWFYPLSVLITLLIPLIPLSVSALLGAAVKAFVSRSMKNKSLVQTVLMLILLFAVLFGTFMLGSYADKISLEKLTDLAEKSALLFGKIYPPALWMGRALQSFDIVGLLLSGLPPLALTGFALWVVTSCYHGIMNRLAAQSGIKNRKAENMKHRGLLKALYLREVKRYFTSSVYVTNTIVGPIMGTLLAGAFLVVGADTLTANVPFDLLPLMPFVLSAVFTMMTTTSTSISMEGKQIWLIKSLPISVKAWLDAKILLNLSLMLPFYLISEALLIIAIKPSFLELIWLLLIPLVIMLFAVVFGITVNKKLYSFDWVHETAVVKQSAAAALGGFAGFLLSLICGGIVFLIPTEYVDLVKALLCVGLLGVTALMYRKNQKIKIEEL